MQAMMLCQIRTLKGIATFNKIISKDKYYYLSYTGYVLFIFVVIRLLINNTYISNNMALFLLFIFILTLILSSLLYLYDRKMLRDIAINSNMDFSPVPLRILLPSIFSCALGLSSTWVWIYLLFKI